MSRHRALEHLLASPHVKLEDAVKLIRDEPRAYYFVNSIAARAVGDAMMRRSDEEWAMRDVQEAAGTAAALALATIYTGDGELKALREQVFQLQERMLTMHRLTPPTCFIIPTPTEEPKS